MLNRFVYQLNKGGRQRWHWRSLRKVRLLFTTKFHYIPLPDRLALLHSPLITTRADLYQNTWFDMQHACQCMIMHVCGLTLPNSWIWVMKRLSSMQLLFSLHNKLVNMNLVSRGDGRSQCLVFVPQIRPANTAYNTVTAIEFIDWSDVRPVTRLLRTCPHPKRATSREAPSCSLRVGVDVFGCLRYLSTANESFVHYSTFALRFLIIEAVTQ